MVKPDRNMSKEEEVIADDENELTLFKLANYIQKGSNAATGKLKVYHDGDLSGGKVYLDFGGGPFMEVFIKPIGSKREELKKQNFQRLEGLVGTY